MAGPDTTSTTTGPPGPVPIEVPAPVLVLVAHLESRAAAAEEESTRAYEAGDQLMATWWDGRRQGLEDAARQLGRALGRPDRWA